MERFDINHNCHNCYDCAVNEDGAKYCTIDGTVVTDKEVCDLYLRRAKAVN